MPGAGLYGILKGEHRGQQGARSAGVVVRAWFLHMRHQHDTFVGARRTRNFGDQRAIRTPVKCRGDVDTDVDRPRRQRVAYALCCARCRFEAKRATPFDERDTAPLQYVRCAVRTCVAGDVVEMTPAAPRSRTARAHSWPAAA